MTQAVRVNSITYVIDLGEPAEGWRELAERASIRPMRILRKLIPIVALGSALVGYAIAQSNPVGSGSYTTTLAWSPYSTNTGAVGFHVLLGTNTGVWSSTNVLDDAKATQLTLTGLRPGQVYFAGIRAFAADGRQSPLSLTTWTNPAPLPAVEGFRPAVIVYVP